MTATARQDDDEADESVLVTHTVSGYGDVTTPRSVTVAVDDDEPPTAAITSPAILTSSVLPIGTGNPTISLLLTGSTFVSGVGPSSFELVTGLTTISIASATTTPGSAIATLTISRSGATSWDKTFAVKVLASAHAGDTDITTPPIDAVFQDTAPSFQSATLPTSIRPPGRGHRAVPDPSQRERRQRRHPLHGREPAGRSEVRRHRHGRERLHGRGLPGRHRRCLGHRAAHRVRRERR